MKTYMATSKGTGLGISRIEAETLAQAYDIACRRVETEDCWAADRAAMLADLAVIELTQAD